MQTLPCSTDAFDGHCYMVCVDDGSMPVGACEQYSDDPSNHFCCNANDIGSFCAEYDFARSAVVSYCNNHYPEWSDGWCNPMC